MKKILVAIAVIITIICFNSCEENYFELPTTHVSSIDSIKSQREWLIEFYNFYNGDEWVNNENWCSPYPLNTWYGIETDSNGYVTAIRLPNNNLKNKSFESSINLAIFPNLHTIDLNRNKIGDLYINNANCLEFVNISNVSGSIEIYNCKKLKSIKCDNSYLNGTSPFSLVNCNMVDSIDLRNSTIEGGLPGITPLLDNIGLSITNNSNLASINITNSSIYSGCLIENCTNLHKIEFSNSIFFPICGGILITETPLLDTLELCNSEYYSTMFSKPFYIGTCRLKNIHCENAIGFRFVFRGDMKQFNITEDFKNCDVIFYGKIDTLNISNYNENTFLIGGDCNYLDVYNSKIGFNKLNTVNKKANFVNSVCDNLIYNNFANGCYLNFENTILNQINGNADAEPVNANCSFYQSYTEWYNHFPK